MANEIGYFFRWQGPGWYGGEQVSFMNQQAVEYSLIDDDPEIWNEQRGSISDEARRLSVGTPRWYEKEPQ